MYRKPSLVLSAVALLISCHSFDPDDVHVLVRTDAASYVAPADVLVRVVNLSAGTLHHGLCLEVERREGAEWVALEYDDEEIPTCPSVLVITKPRQQQELGAHIEDPGEYRLLLWVSTSDSERVDHPFISNAFTIDPGAD